MSFVFTFWYFVIIALVAAIAACLLIFFKMDKKDRVMIDEFIKNSQVQNEAQPVAEENKEVEENKAE